MAKKDDGKDKGKTKDKEKGKGYKPRLQIVPVMPPGKYKITANDMLQSLALRRDLQVSVEELKDCIQKCTSKKTLNEEDIQCILDCVAAVDDATKPIAYGGGEPDEG